MEKGTQTVITKHFIIITTLKYIQHEKLLMCAVVVSFYKTKQKDGTESHMSNVTQLEIRKQAVHRLLLFLRQFAVSVNVLLIQDFFSVALSGLNL